MIQALLLLMFLFITIFFGFIVSRWVLGEKRLFALVPFSVIVGLNAFNLLINTVSHLIPIQYSSWIILGVLLLISIVVYLKNKPVHIEHVLLKNQLRILFGVALGITLLSGIVALRSLALDDLSIAHSSLAVTISEGNFPVVDPSAPNHILSYHYGSDLLSAGIEILTGIPVWFGYDIQIFLFSGTFFLLLFVLLFDITGKFRAAAIGSALFLFGTGVQWLYFFTKGIPAFWQRYVAGVDVPDFWKFLTDVAFPKLNTSYIHTMHNHSVAIGMPLLFFALILYYKALHTEAKKEYWIYILSAGILFGHTALHIETYFVIAFLSFITLLILFGLTKLWRGVRSTFSVIALPRFFSSTLIVLVVGSLLAFFQGGILASMLQDSDRDSLVLVSSVEDFMTFNFAPNPEKVDNTDTFIRLFSGEFFIQFGLPIFLIIPALIFIWRRKEGKLLHLFIMGLGAFLIPFLFRLPTRPWEVSRFFVLAIPIFSLLIGIFLSELYDRYVAVGKKGKAFLVVAAIVLTGITGVISQSMFALTSLDEFGKMGPLVKHPPKAPPLDEKAFAWVAASTTLADNFFPYDPEFIRWSGRYTPGVYPYFTFTLREKEKELYDSIVNDCSLQGIHELNIRYLYVSPQFPIKKTEDCLKKLNAKEVFRVSNTDGFRAIYKIE